MTNLSEHSFQMFALLVIMLFFCGGGGGFEYHHLYHRERRRVRLEQAGPGNFRPNRGHLQLATGIQTQKIGISIRIVCLLDV